MKLLKRLNKLSDRPRRTVNWQTVKEVSLDIGSAVLAIGVIVLIAFIPASWIVRTGVGIFTPEDPAVTAARINQDTENRKSDEEAYKRFEENCKSMGAYMSVGIDKYNRGAWSCEKPGEH